MKTGIERIVMMVKFICAIGFVMFGLMGHDIQAFVYMGIGVILLLVCEE